MGRKKKMQTARIDGWVVQKIPEGALTIDGSSFLNKNSDAKKKYEENKIKQLEKILKRQKAEPLVKTASIKDVEKVLGRNYKIERDKNYKCRRWVVTNIKNKKEWYIRFNDPLIYAIAEINKEGTQKFLKKYTLKSRYR